MKRLVSLILTLTILASCAVLLTACGDKESENFPVSVGGVEITAEPKRVVVLNDAFADILLYMGYDTKLVGRSVDCDQQILSILPSVGYAADPALDTLTKLEPDLVIADETLSESAKNKLGTQNIPVAVLNRATTRDDIKQLYIDLGSALGGKSTGSKKGEESFDKLFDLLSDYSSATKNIVVTDAYLYLDEEGNYCTFVKDSVEEMLLSYNGAMNVFGSKTSPAFHSADITDDQGNVTQADEMYIRYANPTYLFLDGTVAKDGTINSPVYDKLMSDSNLKNITALKQKRVSFIPRKNFLRPGVTFEETLFTMIDVLNKDEEAAEAASSGTTAPTAAPTQAPKKAEPTKAAATKAPATEAPAAEETPDDGAIVVDGEVTDDGAVTNDGAVADGGEVVDNNAGYEGDNNGGYEGDNNVSYEGENNGYAGENNGGNVDENGNPI